MLKFNNIRLSAGLPNIKGNFKSVFTVAKDNGTDTTGALQSPYSKSKGNFGNLTSESAWGYGFKFNASLSNTIYGNSNTVTPESLAVLILVKY